MDDIRDSPGDFPAAFSAAVARLQIAVLSACEREEVWPAKVASAVAATVRFATSDPDSVQLLAVDALIRRPDGSQRYLRTIEHFADLLRGEAPSDRRRPRMTEQALVGGIATTIADRLRHDTPAELLATVPELVEFVLLPYVGPVEAKEWGFWAEQRSRSSPSQKS
jgi:hypothetical protein